MNKKENKETIAAILTALTTATNIVAKKLALLNTTIPQKNADATVELHAGKIQEPFLILLRNEIRQWQVPELIQHCYAAKNNWLLLCTYIPQPIKELLKKEGINYLEAAGNCCIKTQHLFVYINDKAVTPHRQPLTGKLWKATGLRFIFTLLQQPQLLNKPYRDIAQQAGIALGNIGYLLTELQEQGYITMRKEHKKEILYFEQTEALQKKWIELFATFLRPKLIQGRFRFMTPADKARWKTPTLADTCWGGEPAGDLLTNYLEPQQFTLYTTKTATEIIKTWRLLPDAKGEIELLHSFWNMNNTANGETKTAPPLLVYAELATSLDGRNRETAERIKQQYLDKH